ncbi:hypothetical protein NQT62_10370 [Limnobacter humi]|uniref:DUF2834 domain-containing protein n=1 Tax=Limnobacter humi TaxID=1778671 RepID=A0ABT1WHE3_9BURK|nr:hypothetical protein [Limnobacter humi]MCQ8896834.1 hypothetical protein [Limnobacter humi]
MKAFKAFLVIELLILSGYTVLVIQNQGLNLIPHVIDNVLAVSWSGQFNLDFMILLTIAGLWVSWRHGHSPLGMALGLLVTTGGSMVLCPYLLIAAGKAKGNLSTLFMGQQQSCPPY